MVVRAADGGGDRRRHVTVLDQLDARAGVADLLDQIVVAGTVEHDRRHVVHAAAECVGDRLDVLGDRPQQVDRAAGARADRELPHVHVGQRQEAARLADGDHRHRAVAAARDDAAALERVEGEIDHHAAGPERRPGRERLVVGRAEDDPAADRQAVERGVHPAGRRAFGSLLVGAAEPARGEQGSVLGRPQVRLAEAAHRLGLSFAHWGGSPQ